MKQDERQGLLLALAGFAVLTCGDAIIKTLAGEWSPIAVAALRFVIGAVGLAALLGLKEGPSAFRPRRPWIQVARGASLAGSTMFFFAALFAMPLAEATALVFLAPIFTALLSGPLLGEKVRPLTWIASVIAFGGVLLILRPNVAELGWVAFLPLGAALLFSLMVIANRASAGQGSALSMQVYMAGIAAPLLVAAALAGHLSGSTALAVDWPDWTIVARCAAVAVTASIAHWLIFLGTSKAGAALVSPMSYVQLLVAIILGWLLFSDIPDVTTLLGATIIIGAGLALWWQGRPASAPNRH